MSEKEQELSRLRKQMQQQNRERISRDAKERLKKISAKKFRTCFIGALAEFENIFGIDVWGHGLDESQLTEDQKSNREKWEMVRKLILDKGNTQSRSLCAEIDLHHIDFLGYRIECGGKKNVAE